MSHQAIVTIVIDLKSIQKPWAMDQAYTSSIVSPKKSDFCSSTVEIGWVRMHCFWSRSVKWSKMMTVMDESMNSISKVLTWVLVDFLWGRPRRPFSGIRLPALRLGYGRKRAVGIFRSLSDPHTPPRCPRPF